MTSGKNRDDAGAEVLQELVALIDEQSRQPIRQEFICLLTPLQERFPGCLQAVLVYGSALRSESLADAVVDLYVLVEDYRSAYGRPAHRLLNYLAPPNVYYLEVEFQGQLVRAKYAVISAKDFSNGIHHWFHPYMWGRFAQPVRIMFVRNAEQRAWLNRNFADAVVRFLRSSIPILHTGEMDALTLWVHGLQLSYASELRPETHGRAIRLIEEELPLYRKLTRAALPGISDLAEVVVENRVRLHVAPRQRIAARVQWLLRRWQGRLLSVIRFVKAAITFKDCIEYAAWKIHRHTGIEIEITPRLRRYPLLFGWVVVWRLYRRGGLR